MTGDCHIHMILDGVYYRSAMERHQPEPDEALIRQRLEDYRRRGITYLRDGGDRWNVSLTASCLAEEYGIDYRTPVFPICRAEHYGSFIGRGFSDWKEYRQLVEEVRQLGGHFIKIMVSGIMDFTRYGLLTDTPCEKELCKQMVSIAHDNGFSVMVHANGDEAVLAAVEAGADSIEHGAYLGEETLQCMAEHSVVWVPTLVTISKLLGSKRYEDEVLQRVLDNQLRQVRRAGQLGVTIALGTDAGAWGVFHGSAVEEEYELLRQALGQETDRLLTEGERQIRSKF